MFNYSKRQIDVWLENLQSNGVDISLNELVRYKALSRQLNLRPSNRIKSALAGSMSSKFKGRGMEFDEARHYQPGDDIRSIDWRVTARTDKTHTKVFREERERPVMLFVDFHPSMHFGSHLLYKSVQAMHAAALITFNALARQDKIGCVAVHQSNDLECKPKGSSKHGLNMLNQLVSLHQQSPQHDHQEAVHAANQKGEPETLHSGISKLARLAKPGTLIYLLSDFTHFNEASFQLVGKMSRHCEVRPVRIFDPLEEQLPDVSVMQDVLLTDGQREHQLTLGDVAIADEFNKERSAYLAQLKARFESLGLSLRQISAAKPIEQQLQASRAGLILGESS